MLGFVASAAAAVDGSPLPEVVVDAEEMEQVRWFSRDEVAEGLFRRGDKGGEALNFPGPSSMARKLLIEWTEKRI